MVLCFVWIMMMQLVAGFMVWLSLIAVTGLTALGFAFCLMQYISLLNPSPTAYSMTSEPFDSLPMTAEDIQFNFADMLKDNLNTYLTDKTTWLVFSIFIGLILLILILVLFGLRKRIRLAIQLIKEASKYVNSIAHLNAILKSKDQLQLIFR